MEPTDYISYLTSCLICSRRSIIPLCETTTFRPNYYSVYNNRLVESVKPSITYDYFDNTRSEIKSSWDSSWNRNEHNYSYTYKTWTTSRYLP